MARNTPSALVFSNLHLASVPLPLVDTVSLPSNSLSLLKSFSSLLIASKKSISPADSAEPAPRKSSPPRVVEVLRSEGVDASENDHERLFWRAVGEVA